MNIDKAHMKVAVATDIGADIEDRMDGELRAAQELEGAAKALEGAAKKVTVDVAAKVDIALKEGTEIRDGMTTLEVAEVIKKYVTKAGHYLLHLSDVAKHKSAAQRSRADGLRDAMDAVLKLREKEQQKIEGFLKLVEQAEAEGDGEIVPEVPRTPAEAARMQRGSIADRRAAKDPAPVTAEVEVHHKPEPKTVPTETAAPADPKPKTVSTKTEPAPRGKPQNVKKRPTKAAKKRGAKKSRR
jgi:hypothetical protein